VTAGQRSPSSAGSRFRPLTNPTGRSHKIAGPDQVVGDSADLGVIAEAGAEPVGAAWVRFFPADDPAYGFVSSDVPELGIGVAVPWRGRGVGRGLLRAIALLAAEAGIGRISLSVERKNFARGLYLSEGFTVVDASDPPSDTMVKSLADGRPTGAGKSRDRGDHALLVSHPDRAPDDARPSETGQPY
jgi:GNAT superfamily N-acetyltransferase